MAKETLQLQDLDTAIEQKYGSIEQFVENGQDRIKSSLESITKVKDTLEIVQENADKDGRTEHEKTQIGSSLRAFHDLGEKIKGNVGTNTPQEGSHVQPQQKKAQNITSKEIKINNTADNFLNNFKKVKETQEKLSQEQQEQKSLNTMQESIREKAKNPSEQFTNNHFSNTGGEKTVDTTRAKTLRWDGKNVRSTQPGRDIPYEQYVNNYQKTLHKETKKAYGDNKVKKLEVQSEKSSANRENLEDAIIAHELEGNIQGQYRTQPNPEQLTHQNETPMESWIARQDDQSEGAKNLHQEDVKKGSLAQSLEKDGILKKSEETNDSQVATKIPQESLSQELERKKNNSYGKAFSGMTKKLSKLRESLLAKNPKLEKVLSTTGKGLSSFNRWMNKGSQGEKFAKRILISGSLGLAAGLLTGGVGAAAAVAMARGAGSFVGGAGAGFLHKQFTKKGLEQRQRDLKGRYGTEVENKRAEDYTAINNETGVSINIRDRKMLNELRAKNEQGTLVKGEKEQLVMLENARKEMAKNLLTSRNNYWELHQRLLDKNERNNRLVAMAGGILGGVTVRLGPELWDSLIGHPDVSTPAPISAPDAVPEPVPSPETTPIPNPIEHTVSSDAFINKGEGITHALARQINASPELQTAFGLDGPASGQELAKIARDLGYINADGSDVRVLMDHRAAYELRINPDTGKPFVAEFKGGHLEGGAYVGGTEIEQHTGGSAFEGSSSDQYEYVHDGSPQSVSDSERVNFSAKELYPDIDFDKNLNSTIPPVNELEPKGPIIHGEEIPQTPDQGTETIPSNPENKVLLRQQAGGIEIIHSTDGTELRPIEGFQFTGEIDQGDFSTREVKFLERGMADNGYQNIVSFDPSLKPPLSGTHLIQLKNGQYALEKVSFAGTSADAQSLAERSMKGVMKGFGMPGRVEHFNPSTEVQGAAGVYESHAFMPLSDEQAKFIRESYATLNRALTGVRR